MTSKMFAAAMAITTAMGAKITDGNVYTGTGTFPEPNLQANASEFDFDKSFLNNVEFQIGVNIQADEIIAIEAFSRKARTHIAEVQKLGFDSVAEQQRAIGIGEKLDDLVNDVYANERQIRQNAALIYTNSAMIADIVKRLEDLFPRVCINHEALILFCHRYIHNDGGKIPSECQPILLNATETRLAIEYSWNASFADDHVRTPQQAGFACTQNWDDVP